MTSRIKTISLDAETELIVKRQFSTRNFSKFVRQCLLRYDALQHEATCPVESLEEAVLPLPFCIPSPTRVCIKHWPNGPARLQDWKLYREMVANEKEYGWDRIVGVWPYLEAFEDEGKAEGWIQHRARLTNGAQVEFENMDVEGNAKPKTRRQHKTRIRRIMAFLSSKK